MTAKAYYSQDDGCWYVPIASELLHHMESIEPCRLELRDGQLHITLLGDLATHEVAQPPDEDGPLVIQVEDQG